MKKQFLPGAVKYEVFRLKTLLDILVDELNTTDAETALNRADVLAHLAWGIADNLANSVQKALHEDQSDTI